MVKVSDFNYNTLKHYNLAKKESNDIFYWCALIKVLYENGYTKDEIIAFTTKNQKNTSLVKYYTNYTSKLNENFIKLNKAKSLSIKMLDLITQILDSKEYRPYYYNLVRRHLLVDLLINNLRYK